MTKIFRLALVSLTVFLPGCGGSSGSRIAFFQEDVQVNDVLASPDSTNPAMCCDGKNVYIAWNDERNGDDDIFFSFSRDGGKTWSADVRIDRGNTEDVDEPSICCFGQNIYVTWEDERDGQGDIYLNYSTDGGVSWQNNDIRLDTDTLGGAFLSERPRICCDGLRVNVVWEDDRDGETDIYSNYSDDGGANWQTNDIRVDLGDNPGANESEDAEICCDGLRVYVVWVDDRNGATDIYSNYSDDGGANWQTDDIRVDLGDNPGDNTSEDARICCDGQRVYVIWSDDRQSEFDICGSYSFDGGATWVGAFLINDERDSEADEAQICCEGLNVYVSWSDERNGDADIFTDYSRDGGITWNTDQRLDRDDLPGANDSSEPQICCSGRYVSVAFRDNRDGEDDVYVNYSTDSGVTWLNNEIRMNGSVPAGTADADDPRICCDGAAIYTAWEDDRDDPTNSDLLENVFFNGSS